MRAGEIRPIAHPCSSHPVQHRQCQARRCGFSAIARRSPCCVELRESGGYRARTTSPATRATGHRITAIASITCPSRVDHSRGALPRPARRPDIPKPAPNPHNQSTSVQALPITRMTISQKTGVSGVNRPRLHDTAPRRFPISQRMNMTATRIGCATERYLPAKPMPKSSASGSKPAQRASN